MTHSIEPNDSIEVVHCIGGRMLGIVTFPPGAIAGQVPCHECLGTGWWGYGPSADTCGPCICCKGTGREWLGL